MCGVVGGRGGVVRSVSGSGDKIPHASRPKNQSVKQKQCRSKLNKGFKNDSHQNIYIYIYI